MGSAVGKGKWELGQVTSGLVFLVALSLSVHFSLESHGAYKAPETQHGHRWPPCLTSVASGGGGWECGAHSIPGQAPGNVAAV